VRDEAVDAKDVSDTKPTLSARTVSVPTSQTSVDISASLEKPSATRRNSLPTAVSENDNPVGEAGVSSRTEVAKVATVSRSASAVTPGTKDQRLKEAVADVKLLQPKR
jgi:hypothetical protein